MNGDHHRLGAPAVAGHGEIKRIDQPQWHRLDPGTHQRRDGGQIQPCGEVIACGVQNAHAQRRVIVQPRVGLAQFPEHLGCEAVALIGPVDADLQNAALHRAINAAFRVDF